MTTETPLTTEPGPARRLVRPHGDRILAGVAAGIGHRLDMPVWLVRVLFVIAATFGGFGVIAYVAAWLLIPEEGSEDAPAARLVDGLGRSGWIGIGIAVLGLMAVNGAMDLFEPGAVFGLAMVVIGVLVYTGKTPIKVASNEAVAPAETMAAVASPTPSPATETGWAGSTPPPPAGHGTPSAPPPPPAPPAPRSPLGRFTVAAGLIVLGTMALIERLGYVDLVPRHYLSAAMAMTAIGLIVGTWFGRARGLIVLGIALTPMLVLSPLAEIEYRDFGQVVVRPASVGEIQPVYTRDVGTLIVDLSALDLQGQSLEITAHVDLGELVIVVPSDAAVTGSARVDLGDVHVFGAEKGGIGTISEQIDRPGSNGTIDLNASTDVGRVLITIDPEDSRIGDGPMFAGESAFVIDDPSELSERYEIATGSLTIDLSDLVLTEPRDVRIQMGAGEIIVILPDQGRVAVDATAGLGEVTVAGRSDSGFAPRVEIDEGDALLDLRISVGAGSITVEDQS